MLAVLLGIRQVMRNLLARQMLGDRLAATRVSLALMR
jgi:hypothetical protein